MCAPRGGCHSQRSRSPTRAPPIFGTVYPPSSSCIPSFSAWPPSTILPFLFPPLYLPLSLSLCPPLILLSLSLSLPPFTPPSAPSSHALPRHHSTHPHSFTSTSQRVHMLEVRQRAAACILSFPSNLSATATAPRIPPLAAARHPDSTTTPCQWQRAAPRVEHSLFPSLKF